MARGQHSARLAAFEVAHAAMFFGRGIEIAALAVRSPSLRVLASARSDFLSRLAMLPGLGDEMARGLYFLRPLGGRLAPRLAQSGRRR